MSDRDDLLELLALHTQNEIDAGNAADAILAAGWRRSTVTPEQVERAVSYLAEENADYLTDRHETISELAWRYDVVQIVERLGLSVAEDGGQ